MLRRFVSARALAPTLSGKRFLTVGNDDREGLTKHLTALKEECKGQGMDLADMSDAAKMAMHSFQDSVKKSSIDDAQFKGKMTTLAASVKAYNTRLSNLQNESRSIQAEVDALMKLLWGTEQPHGANFAKPPPPSSSSSTSAADNGGASSDTGFSVEPPPIAKIVEDINKGANVERVDGERITAEAKPDEESAGTEEIEVETIEIEVEETPESASSSSGSSSDGTADTMKITDITKDLYERGVNFSDCLDARSLRQRYKDVLSGKIPSGPAQPTQKPYTEPLNTNTSQPRMPPRAAAASSPSHTANTGSQYQQPPPNTADTGLTSDPYPNAHRKMIDAMKYVWEVKQELAAEKGIDANSVDLWSGKVKLEDHKRLYDYPSIQSYPIEVRQKGDVPH